MEVYKIKNGGLEEIRKKLFIYSLIITLLVLSFVIALNYFSPKTEKSDIGSMYFIILIIVITIASSIGILQGMKKTKLLFESFTLTILHNKIMLEQINTPTITILNTDIKEIYKTSIGSFTIIGNTRDQSIGIPAQIEKTDQLEKSLNQIKTISIQTKKNFYQKFLIPLLIIVSCLMGILYISTNKILVGISGILLTLILIWGLKVTKSSKKIDYNTKKYRFMLFFLIFAIIGRTVVVLFFSEFLNK